MTTSEKPKRILLVGLAETGKSSFLAALYHYVCRDSATRCLEQYQLSENDEYLNHLESAWLRGQKLQRTASVLEGLPKDVILYLKERRSDRKFDLHIPDIAGESFMHQFAQRQWNLSYKEEVESAIGVILFVTKKKLRPHILLDDVAKIRELFEVEVGNVNFDKEKIPTQVVLTDVLRSHKEFMKSHKLRLSVVISAWDEVESEGHRITPLRWIEVNLPLFYQYLHSNSSSIDYKAFGISAIGCNPENKEEMSMLLDLNDAADRIKVQDAEEVSNNICAPIEWIID